MKERNLRVKQKVFIDIIKKADVRDVFGTLKTKTSGQKFKQMCKESAA